jgi:hypothetical protein
MELYHTGNKFGGGPRNAPRVPKFLPPSCRPPLFLSWRSWHAVAYLVERKQFTALLRIKALCRLHCCVLAVCGYGEGGREAVDPVKQLFTARLLVLGRRGLRFADHWVLGRFGIRRTNRQIERAMRGVTPALSACRRPLHRRLAESGKAYCVTAAIARS